MKAVNIIIAAAIIMCCLWGTTAWGTPVTIPYEFVQDESTVLVEGMGPFRYYSIEGQFVLNVDYDVGIASFEQVNATLSGEILYYDYDVSDFLLTKNLDVLFELTELESVYVSETKIDFLLERNIPHFPLSDVHLTITFMDDSLHITGYFGAPVYDGPSYTLNAAASIVPEPGTLFLLALGGLLMKRMNQL